MPSRGRALCLEIEGLRVRPRYLPYDRAVVQPDERCAQVVAPVLICVAVV